MFKLVMDVKFRISYAVNHIVWRINELFIGFLVVTKQRNDDECCFSIGYSLMNKNAVGFYIIFM